MECIHLQAGAELQNGKYRIERVLGQGGFGITYLAVNTLFDRKVAIKEFFPKDYCDRDATTSHITIGTTLNTELVYKLKEKFLRETRNIARLDNDNIVSVYDVFEENDTAYYVMQYIEGETLKELIDRDGPMTESQALCYFIPVARAVEYMHSRLMNHLDIKPANIMVRKADGVPMLIDFGSSKQYDKEGDATSSMMPGLTHGYAPMEQYRPGGVAQFTPQSDVYALGATLLFLLTGRKPPHYSEIMEEGLPALPAGVSQQTRLAIEHAMKPRKLDRPESIPQFLAELPQPQTTPVEDKVPGASVELSTPQPKEPTQDKEESKVSGQTHQQPDIPEVPHTKEPKQAEETVFIDNKRSASQSINATPPPPISHSTIMAENSANKTDHAEFQNYMDRQKKKEQAKYIWAGIAIVAFLIFVIYFSNKKNSSSPSSSNTYNEDETVVAVVEEAVDGSAEIGDSIVTSAKRSFTIKATLPHLYNQSYNVAVENGKLKVNGDEFNCNRNVSPEQIIDQFEGLAYYWAAASLSPYMVSDGGIYSDYVVDDMLKFLSQSAYYFGSGRGKDTQAQKAMHSYYSEVNTFKNKWITASRYDEQMGIDADNIRYILNEHSTQARDIYYKF